MRVLQVSLLNGSTQLVCTVTEGGLGAEAPFFNYTMIRGGACDGRVGAGVGGGGGDGKLVGCGEGGRYSRLPRTALPS